MIILPDQTASRGRLFLPLKRSVWMPPSLHQPKNRFGHAAIEWRFHVKAVLADGFVRWHGVFEDRDDWEAFLRAVALQTLDRQPELWRLPVPNYCPDYGEGAFVLWATTIIVTASGSQGVPGDWDNSANTIDGIGGGGSGACGCKANGNRGTGGSGAEWRKITNYAASGTFTYTIGAGGAAASRTTAGQTAGNDGGDTILDTTALIAKKGLGGTILNGSNPTSPVGGSGGTGGEGYAGGGGGFTGVSNDIVTGGGGAGGSFGVGFAGASAAANNTATSGGGGNDGSSTGGSGSFANSASPVTGGNGGAGTEWGSAGSGAGGGAANNLGSGTAIGGSGGSYGGGGGGSNTKNGGGNSTSGAGAGGILFFTYTPAAGSILLQWHQAFTEPRRFKKSVAVPAVPFEAMVKAAPFPEVVSYDRWAYPWSNPYPAKKWLRPAAHPFESFHPNPIVSIPWFNPLAEPRRYKAALIPATQLAFTFHPNPIVHISWWRPLDEPRRYKTSLRTGQHLFHSFHPNPVIHISWWRPLDEPRRFRRRLREGLQMTLTMNIQPVVSFSWIYGLSEPVRKKPTLIEAAKEKSTHMIFVRTPGSTGPLFIRAKLGRRATFWKGRSDGR